MGTRGQFLSFGVGHVLGPAQIRASSIIGAIVLHLLSHIGVPWDQGTMSEIRRARSSTGTDPISFNPGVL